MTTPISHGTVRAKVIEVRELERMHPSWTVSDMAFRLKVAPMTVTRWLDAGAALGVYGARATRARLAVKAARRRPPAVVPHRPRVSRRKPKAQERSAA